MAAGGGKPVCLAKKTGREKNTRGKREMVVEACKDTGLVTWGDRP